MKCPKCQAENTDTAKFCSECAAPLRPINDIGVTKTLETPAKGLELGSTFAGRYQIIEELGKGGMGAVYKALDTQINEEVAIKLIRPEIAADEKVLERFSNELKLARKIAHKNVCRMYHLEKGEETPYISMEYLEGIDLKKVIREKEEFEEEEVIGIAKQVCEGLSEAHRLGVVHRDLKPQNIMIDKDGQGKIMDFGIARSVEAPGVTQTGVIIGTPDYISPEQAEGKEADHRSDIYSLGVILYEMLTGSVPFKGDTALSVALKHKSQLPSDPRKLNPEVSEDLARLILICLEKDKERRYQTAAKLLGDLTNIKEGFPLGTKFHPRRRTFVSTLIRKKIFIPALVLALVIIVIAVWQLLRDRETGFIPGSGKPSLAVVYFENITGDERFDHWRKALPRLLTTDLSESKLIDVLPGDQLYKILADLNQLDAESYSSDVLRDVAAKSGVENILLGSLTKSGNMFRINVSLQNARTGRQLGTETVEGQGDESFFDLVDQLTPTIKGFFNLSAEEISGDRDLSIGMITTNSPEAYRIFSEGLECFLNGDQRRAVQYFERAVTLDSEFASAYRWMAWAYNEMVYKSAFKENIQKAYYLSEKLPERERLQIEGDYYLSSEETYDKAIAAYEKYLEIYPDNLWVQALLGHTYNKLEEWDKAEERLRMCVENNSSFYGPHGNLAMSYQARGMYDKAKEILENYLENISEHSMIRLWLSQNYTFMKEYELAVIEADKVLSYDPDIYYNIFSKGYAYISQGEWDKAENEFNKLKQKKDIISQIWALGELSTISLVRGEIEEAIKLIKQGVSLTETMEAKEEESNYRLCLARLYLKSGDINEALAEAVKAYETAVEAEHHYLQRTALYFQGIAHLRAKSLDSASKKAKELKEFLENGLNKKAYRFYYALMGHIELEKQNLSQAIEFFKQALSLSPSPSIRDIVFIHKHITLFLDPLAFAQYEAGDLENALEKYKRISLLPSSSICLEGDTYVKSFYMLGRIYERQGKKVKSIEHYEKFLDLWKDADPGIAEVEDAKKRLVGLR